MKRIPSKAATAFTIIEVMIAITIFAAVLVAIYSSWAAVVRGSKAGLKAAGDMQRARMASRIIEGALTTGEIFAENLQHYAFRTDTSSDFGTLSLVSRLPSSFPGAGIYGDQVMRRVTFFVDQSNQLVMTQAPYLLAPIAGQEPYSIVLAKNVSLFSFNFLDTNVNNGDWTDEWAFTNRFPQMIRYALAFNSDKTKANAPQELVTSVVAMPAIAGAQLVQQITGGTGPLKALDPNNQLKKNQDPNQQNTGNTIPQQPQLLRLDPRTGRYIPQPPRTTSARPGQPTSFDGGGSSTPTYQPAPLPYNPPYFSGGGGTNRNRTNQSGTNTNTLSIFR